MEGERERERNRREGDLKAYCLSDFISKFETN